MRLAPLLLALCGASIGWAGVLTWERVALERGPEGFDAQAPAQPMAAAHGEGAALPGAGWPLSDHVRWVKPNASGLELLVEVPEGARIEVALVREGGEDALVLARSGGEGVARLVRRRGPAIEALDCAGTLTLPVEGPFEVWLHQAANLSARVGDSEAQCDVTGVVREARVAAGMARVSVLRVGDLKAPPPAWGLRAGASIGGALLLGGLGLLRRRSRWPLVAAPLLACGPLASADWASWLVSARIPGGHPLSWTFVLPGAVALLGLCAAWVVDRTRAARPTWSAVLPVLVLASLAFVIDPRVGALAIGAAIAFVGLLQVNVLRPRGFNVISLGLVALLVGCLEGALRNLAVGDSWAGLSARETAALNAEFVELEETRRHRDWPDRGYPVSPQARDGRTRLVAFGGSSTGGAFVNDDLDDFYPAEIGRRIDVQVLNQGVGGWTTLHIRRYLETRLDDVDPDIAVLYVGHNDLLTPASVPYAQALAQWQERGGRARISSALRGLRLYQGLRFVLGAFGEGPRAVAVPIDDARENLEAILGMFDERGVSALLVCEAVSIEHSALAPYAELMSELAQDRDAVRVVDVASALEDPARSGMFVDNVHLTQGGHGLLADQLVADLLASGWLEDEAGR